jgi:hypothetical protein
MSAGLPKFVTVNLSDLEKAFEAGATVDLQSVQAKKLLNISGRDTKLPLKVRCCAVLYIWLYLGPRSEQLVLHSVLACFFGGGGAAKL